MAPSPAVAKGGLSLVDAERESLDHAQSYKSRCALGANNPALPDADMQPVACLNRQPNHPAQFGKGRNPAQAYARPAAVGGGEQDHQAKKYQDKNKSKKPS
jgi:hypothetical protein